MSGNMVRKLDELGRLVIPMELRRRLGWDIRQPVAIRVENDEVIISRYRQACALCGSTEGDLADIRGSTVCQTCMVAVRNLGSRGYPVGGSLD